jgi:hypothetical protein
MTWKDITDWCYGIDANENSTTLMNETDTNILMSNLTNETSFEIYNNTQKNAIAYSNESSIIVKNNCACLCDNFNKTLSIDLQSFDIQTTTNAHVLCSFLFLIIMAMTFYNYDVFILGIPLLSSIMACFWFTITFYFLHIGVEIWIGSQMIGATAFLWLFVTNWRLKNEISTMKGNKPPDNDDAQVTLRNDSRATDSQHNVTM